MATLCSICNRLIENDDICPYCGAFVSEPDTQILPVFDSGSDDSPSGGSDSENLLGSLLDDVIIAQSSQPGTTPEISSVQPEGGFSAPESDTGMTSETDNEPSDTTVNYGSEGFNEENAADEESESSGLAETTGQLDFIGESDSSPEPEPETDNDTERSGDDTVNSETLSDDSLFDTAEIDGFFTDPEESAAISDENEDIVTNSEEPAQVGSDIPVIPEKRKNALEDSIDVSPREVRGNRMFRFLIVVVILAVLALSSAIVMSILMPMQQKNREKREIITYLQGAWISDKFAFFDSTSKDFAEVLTVDEDGGFTMLYAVPDEAYPDGWSNGKWQVEDQVEGQIEYDIEGKRLLLLYEKEGEDFFFERFFILMEEDKICLREYYDASNESYYDVVLHRIKM